MKAFASVFQQVDQSTEPTATVAALASYFRTAPDSDRLWAIALFSGRRPKRTTTPTRLRDWAAEHAALPLWLIEDAYPVVGDLAETIALIVPPPTQARDHSLSFWINVLRDLSDASNEVRKSRVLSAWDQLDVTERIVFNKLITGSFRVGVSQTVMTRALAQATGKPVTELAHRLMRNWSPDDTSFHRLIHAGSAGLDASRPYALHPACPLVSAPEQLGDPCDWRAEWKWDGIRGQLILRDNQVFVWSPDDELMTNRFPELSRAQDFLPDGTVLDGDLLAWDGQAPLPFRLLQKRIGRKTVPRSLLRDAPAILYAHDLLEWRGRDLRDCPFDQRRTMLEQAIGGLPDDSPVRLSPRIAFDDWGDLTTVRAAARGVGAAGLMLKRANSRYSAGRDAGNWWTWAPDPLTIDAVMIYAQSGQGRRATLFTDFTFAVWQGNDLIPVAKAESSLTDAELCDITAWVRKNTVQRFGPVRQVTPHHVFEIAFDGIHASPRHKSGVALRCPRMVRWRQDKPVQDADTLDALKDMLAQFG